MNASFLLAKNLKNLRLTKGLSQGELAKKIGVSKNTIFLIESQKSWIRKETLLALSKFFDVSSDSFFAPDGLSKLASDLSVKKESKKSRPQPVEAIKEIKSLLKIIELELKASTIK